MQKSQGSTCSTPFCSHKIICAPAKSALLAVFQRSMSVCHHNKTTRFGANQAPCNLPIGAVGGVSREMMIVLPSA
jgi:hypothetical protein